MVSFSYQSEWLGDSRTSSTSEPPPTTEPASSTWPSQTLANSETRPQKTAKEQCFFDLPPAVRRDLVDFKDGVARQFWMGRVENEFFTKGVSRCHCVLGFVCNMRTHRSEHHGGASRYCNLSSQ